MVLPQQQSHDENPRMTPEDYLAFERDMPDRYEYIGGRVYMMTGTSRNHNRIEGNIYTSLRNRFGDRPCEVFVESIRVQVQSAGAYVYPDLIAICGEQKVVDGVLDTLTNPQVIFEVQSPSTKSYDRNGKFDLYRRIDTLQEYLLISQDTPHIAHYVRQANGAWLPRDIVGLDGSLTIAALDVTLALADVYEKVEFPGDEDEA